MKTPVTELPTFDQFDFNDHTLSWNFKFPEVVDAERIVVNTGLLRTIQRIGSIGSSHVYEYNGDTTQVSLGVNGVDQQGTATASRALTVKKAETQKSSVVDDLPIKDLMKDYFKAHSVHRVNKSEVLSNVVDKIRESGGKASREELWANEIDTAFRASMRESLIVHLMNRIDLRRQAFYSMVYASNASSILSSAMIGDMSISGVAMTTTTATAALFVGADTLMNKKLYGQTFLADRRWSLAFFGGWQPDRYLAATALLYTSPLVTARK